ncbi:MAG: MotA/TolQ/ExbB proton channel family protein [Bacteroidales bacterium]|nr:MotA/TolQ/ExbB proton channel family protein [Bacteroidales bacterium]MDD4576059.1 MotA/TolQ/ExbB proton channel family protein [Bacteroidales bacterium]
MITGIILQVTQAVNETAEVATQIGVAEYEKLSLWKMMLKGGWIMIPLAIMSILAIYLFIERFLTIKKASKEESNFMNNIRDFVHNGRLDSALALCKNTESPLARMIEKGLLRIGKPLSDINTAIETVGRIEVSRLEKGIAMIATIAGAAPMIGFLGTVTGMVRAFYDMSKAGNNIDIQLLSSGIYEAMVTTIAGLIVGITAYICYNILVARIENVVFQLEARATEFMDLLNEPAN